eukprot:1247630-Pleurochrysis_carterae.AAC.1
MFSNVFCSCFLAWHFLGASSIKLAYLVCDGFAYRPHNDVCYPRACVLGTNGAISVRHLSSRTRLSQEAEPAHADPLSFLAYGRLLH